MTNSPMMSAGIKETNDDWLFDQPRLIGSTSSDDLSGFTFSLTFDVSIQIIPSLENLDLHGGTTLPRRIRHL
jgi:hypothetical protein